MEFKHRPLQSNSLRLLRPVTIEHDHLAFEISHHPHEAAPPYTAVSYTWGNNPPTEQVCINERSFRIRVNLWSCLHYLGNAVKFGNVPWKYLWVDAICIDQNNDQERNAQVRLMDQIYRNAIAVSVWLGLPPMPEFVRLELDNYRKPIKTYEEEVFDWFDSIENLANRPYWSRFWVIQECLLGKRVDLYCGNTCMDWWDFRTLLGQKTGVYDVLSEDVNYAQSPYGSWAAWPLITGRHPDKHPQMTQSLYKLLITHSKSECKDPRDRVFALLGLVTPDEKTLRGRFLPDYTMNEDNVVLIVICHVQLGVINPQGESINMKRLLIALGVNSVSRQRRLVRRSREYDYLGELPPNPHWSWFDDQEAGELDVDSWENGTDPENDDFHVQNWGVERNTRAADQGISRTKRAMYMLGTMVFLLMVLKTYRPRVWKVSVSLILSNIAKARTLFG